MPTSKLDYFKALIVCCLAAFGYEQMVVPMVVDRPEMQPLPAPAHKDTTNPQLVSHFPLSDWRRQNPRQIRTPMGVLLFKELEQISQYRWRLTPITLVLTKRNGDASQRDTAEELQRAVILDAPLGAEVEFRRSAWRDGRFDTAGQARQSNRKRTDHRSAHESRWQ